MIFFALSIVLQIMCVLHVIRTGRQQIWIWVIVLFSALGCCAYFAFEIMPELFGPGSARARASQGRQAADPVRRLKAAEEALALVETPANHCALADAHFDMGGYRTAADHYRKALDCLHGRDAKIEKKLAEALFQAGDGQEALKLVESLDVPIPMGEADRLALLKARILEYLGRDEEAAEIFADIVTRLPGEEARCHYAALLLKMDRADEAEAVLETVAAHVRQRGKPAMEEPMHQWALRELDRLRSAA